MLVVDRFLNRSANQTYAGQKVTIANKPIPKRAKEAILVNLTDARI